MTGIAGTVLGCFPLDVVWCCIQPCWKGVEIGEQILAVIGKRILCNGHMPQENKVIRSFVTLNGILSDEEGHVRPFGVEVGLTSLVQLDMATIAALVVDGMADLASQVSTVHLVLIDSIQSCSDDGMAGFTTRLLETAVTVGIGGHGVKLKWAGVAFRTGIGLSMHFITAMTIDAGHASLAEVDVGFQALVFTKKFIANPAAMAGGACSGHGWRLYEGMAVE